MSDSVAVARPSDLPLIRLKLRNLVESGACSTGGKALAELVIDLADVVDAMAGQ